jgi:repeat uncharacterized protein DUF347
MTQLPASTLSKVPEVTLGFWVIKVLATTLGETGGDAVTMSMNLGYAIGSFIFIGIFAAAVVAQISAKAFHPFLYWVTIVATTTLGTTMADFADRSVGVGYFGGCCCQSVACIISSMLAPFCWLSSVSTRSFLVTRSTLGPSACDDGRGGPDLAPDITFDVALPFLGCGALGVPGLRNGKGGHSTGLRWYAASELTLARPKAPHIAGQP